MRGAGIPTGQCFANICLESLDKAQSAMSADQSSGRGGTTSQSLAIAVRMSGNRKASLVNHLRATCGAWKSLSLARSTCTSTHGAAWSTRSCRAKRSSGKMPAASTPRAQSCGMPMKSIRCLAPLLLCQVVAPLPQNVEGRQAPAFKRKACRAEPLEHYPYGCTLPTAGLPTDPTRALVSINNINGSSSGARRSSEALPSHHSGADSPSGA